MAVMGAIKQRKKNNKQDEVYTMDGTVDWRGHPSSRQDTGRWFAGVIILVNQGLATLAFFGVGVNLVLFLTRVLGQNNADAANTVSKWTGTVYIFSLAGAFLRIPPASMSSFDILSVAAFIFIYRRVLDPLVSRIKKVNSQGLTELQRMGIGLIIAVMAMISAGIVECYRLKYAPKDCPRCKASGLSSLSIFWQIPQYCLIGASEVFMYVGQLEFFNAQAPDGLKSFGSALCMTSISLGNYVSSLLVSVVMKISTEDHMPGWIPGNLNRGHLDRFFFLLAALTTIDFLAYVACAKCYKCIKRQRQSDEDDAKDECNV